MTAPLPPPTGTIRVPMIDDECNHRGYRDVPAWDADAVKLAVRKALEQLLTETRPSVAIGSRAAARIRAMIEEYK